MRKSNNTRMFQQLASHEQKSIPATSVQDLIPRPCADNAQCQHGDVFMSQEGI
jgi:hypothetical protein